MLRPYQQECIQAIMQKLVAWVRLQLCVLATGTGKTFIFSQLPKLVASKWKKTLILAHREELLTQAKATVEKVSPTLKVGIEQWNNRADADCDVVVASAPTLGRESSNRISQWKKEEFWLIIIDEAHHATGSTYQNVLSYFSANKLDTLSEGHPVVLWFTATPNRADNVWLEGVFEEVVYSYDIKKAVSEGYLSRIKAYTIDTKEKISNVTIRAGDFAIGELSEAVNKVSRNSLIVETWNHIAKDESTLVFCVDVAHARELKEAFSAKGISAEYVVWDTPTEDRKKILSMYSTWAIKVVLSVGVLTEWFDAPRTSCVMMARPTKSGVLFLQCVGRGTRLFEGKEAVKVIDFVDNFDKHTVITCSSLIWLEKPILADWHDIFEIEAKYKALLEANPFADYSTIPVDEIESRIKEVDVLKIAEPPAGVKTSSSYAWHRYFEGCKISIGQRKETQNNCVAEIRENTLWRWEAKIIEQVPAKPSFANGFSPYTNTVLSTMVYTDLISAVEDTDKRIFANFRENMHLISRDATRRTAMATDKQISMLKKLWMANGHRLNKWQASALLSKLLSEKKQQQMEKLHKKRFNW